MKALTISDESLVWTERETPQPVADQVLVEVAGAGMNRADLLQVKGGYAAPPGWPDDIPGLEFAGTVVETGEGVRRLHKGDRVFGIVGGGAHATHLITHEALCAPVPEGIDLVEAGGIPESFVTAQDAMLVQAGLRPGERVLIHGVGSGVGTAAVQLARAVGASTVGTSRTQEKLERAVELGLDDAVLAEGDIAAQIGDVDVVIDLIGGSYLELDVAVCKTKGRVVIVGLIAGAKANLDMARLMRSRLRIMGTVLRSRPEHEKAAAMAAFEREVVPLLEGKVLRPVIDRTMPLEDGPSAYDALASNRSFGKIVLTP